VRQECFARIRPIPAPVKQGVPSRSMTLEQFLSQYGLIALFLLATVEGDASLILAGMLAHRGVLSLPAVIIAGAAGNFVGDCAWYFLGRQARARLRDSAIYRRAGGWKIIPIASAPAAAASDASWGRVTPQILIRVRCMLPA